MKHILPSFKESPLYLKTIRYFRQFPEYNLEFHHSFRPLYHHYQSKSWSPDKFIRKDNSPIILFEYNKENQQRLRFMLTKVLPVLQGSLFLICMKNIIFFKPIGLFIGLKIFLFLRTFNWDNESAIELVMHSLELLPCGKEVRVDTITRSFSVPINRMRTLDENEIFIFSEFQNFDKDPYFRVVIENKLYLLPKEGVIKNKLFLQKVLEGFKIDFSECMAKYAVDDDS